MSDWLPPNPPDIADPLVSIQKNEMKHIIKLISIIAISSLTYFITKDILISFIVGLISLFLFWIYSPERRYWRAFWYVLVALAVTNNWTVQFYRSLNNGNLEVKYEDNLATTIILGILLIVLAILDFQERNKSVDDKPKTRIDGDENIIVNDVENSNISIKK